MATNSRPSFSRRLLWLGLLAGFAPIAVQTALWLAGNPSWVALRAAAISAGIGAVFLIALVWLLPARLAAGADRSVADLGNVFERVSQEDLAARSLVTGPGREFRTLSGEVNALIDAHKREVLNRRLEVEQSDELRVASRHLIEECIYAREPLAKLHPGLASGYAEAAIRHSGKSQAGNATIDGLVRGVDTAGTRKGNRENHRWSLDNITVEVPVPSRLLNMSVSGMAVESNRGLPVGGSWVFRIGNGSFAYDIPGKVRWCRLNRTVKIAEEIRPIYRTGVAFDRRLEGRAFDFFSPVAPGRTPSSATG